MAALLVLAVACSQPETQQTQTTSSAPEAAVTAAIPAELKPALEGIVAAELLAHTKALSSDELEGRSSTT
jgi:hypothetical protein